MNPNRVSARMRGRPEAKKAEPVVQDVPELFELEEVVMDHMWRVDKATVREMLEAINETGPRERAYTTILTTVRRLYAKGFLRRERHDRTDTYMAALSREDYVSARARSQVEALVSEYGDVALANFARQVEGLDPAKLSALRKMAGQTNGDS